MRLASIRVRNVGPFDDVLVRFADAPSLDPDGNGDEGATPATPRPVTVLFGGGGTGKTTLLAALAVTRPGFSLPPPPHGQRTSLDRPSSITTEWTLGDDDPGRPHPLVVTSPTALLDGETPEMAAVRRREQGIFDRRAQTEGGFVFVSFSGARWFSRAASTLTTPDRSVLRYDVRSAASFDDPTRADLTRETKQVLSYAEVARAVAGGRAEYVHLTRFETALREVVEILLEPFGYRYNGVSPTTLEPEVRDESGRIVPFDALPRPARHLVAFGAITLRSLFAAYPGAEEPRGREGVVAIDDAESQQDPSILRILVPLLRRALPNVQWILSTSSTQLAMECAAGEVAALRRSTGTGSGIEVGEGVLH